MPTASTSKPGMSRLPTAGGSRIPIAGGSRIPAFGGRTAVAGKAPAKEKEDAPAAKKRVLIVQESPNPKARKILKASNASAPAASKLGAAQKSTQPIAQKRPHGSPPASARKRQRLDLPLRSSLRASDPLDVIPPTPPRTTRDEHSIRPHSPISPPHTQAPIERARSTTAFNIPLGDQSSLLGGAGMDISSGGLYSDFENGGTPSPKTKGPTPPRTSTSNRRRSSVSRRSSVTPKPRQKSATPRRSPKSSTTPRRYEPKTLPAPIVTPTAMQARKEARLAEARAKLAAARSEPALASTMTGAQARLAAAQAEAEKRLRMSVESEETEGLSVVQEESYQEEESDQEDGSWKGEEEEEGEETEVERSAREEEQEGDEEEEEGLDTLQPLRDDDDDPPVGGEEWSQTETPRPSGSKTPRARGTTTPAFKPTTTPATRPTTTPAYKPTTTPATLKPARTVAPTTTPATGFKGKRKAKFQDTPHPEASESPSEYDPGDSEEPRDPPLSNPYRRPSLGYSLSQLSLNTPHHPSRSQQTVTAILQETGEIASRTRSRRASDDWTRRESISGAMNGLNLAEQGGDLSMAVPDDDEDEEEEEEEEEEEDETIRRPRKSITTTPRAPAPSYSTTPRDYPSTTPRTEPSTTPRTEPSTTPGNTSTTPRNDPSTASTSTTPYYHPSTTPGDSTTPHDDPSTIVQSRRLRKSDSPVKGRGKGRGRGRGSRGGASPTRADHSLTQEVDLSRTSGGDPSPSRGKSSSRGRGRGGRSVSRDERSFGEETTFAEGQSELHQSLYDDQSTPVGRSPTRRGRGRGRGRASPQKRGGANVSRVSRTEVEQESESEGFSGPDETTFADQAVKTKSPMKVEVVIPQRNTSAFKKSVLKTPAFKPTSSTPLFKPSSSTTSSYQPSTSASFSQPTTSTSGSRSATAVSTSLETSTSSFKPSTSTSTSAFSSPNKITLQQPTPELSSLDRSPGSHQEMITDASVDVEHTYGGDMNESIGSQHDFTTSQHDSTGSQHESNSSRQDMDESNGSRQDQDVHFTSEVPETSLPSTSAERSHATTKSPTQSSFSHLLERDMTMRSERTTTMRMETSQRTTTIHADISRSTTMSRSTSNKSHTPATKKKPAPKKTPGLKILSDSQASRLNAFTPRAPPAPVDDSIEFTPASGLDFNDSHMDFDETPATGAKFAQSTPFIRNGTRPSLGLGSFQKLHLDESSEEEEEIPDSQPPPSDHEQPSRVEVTPQREISVAVDTSSPNRSLRTERVATPRAPRLSNPMDDEEEEEEPELPPSPSAGRSSLHEGNSLPDGNGINGRRLSDILMLRAKQARDRSGDLSRDQSGRSDALLEAGEMTRLSDQARSVLRSSGSGSKAISTGNESQPRAGNRSTSFGASTSRNPGHSSRDRSAFETNRTQRERTQDYDASVHFDQPSRTTRRPGTPILRRPSEPQESDEDEVSSIPDQTEELRSSGASVVSAVPSDGPEEEYEQSEPASEEEMDYDENGEPIIKLSGPPEALVEAKSALIQLGYTEDEERMEHYSRVRSSRSRSRSISRAGNSTRNISIGSSPRSHLADSTTGVSRSQMMAEASRYEDWEPPSRYQLRARKWTEHDWRMLAHYMRRVQKSQALQSGLSSRQDFDLKRVDIPAVVERFVEEEAHGVKLEGEWDPSEIAGRVEFLIKTEGYKRDGSWKSTIMNITAPGFSTQKTRRYEREASPEAESPAKGRMLPTALSELPGPSRIAAAQKQVIPNTSLVVQHMTVSQTTKLVAHNPKQVSPRKRQTVPTTVAEPVRYQPRQEPEDMSVDQPSFEEPSGEEPSADQPSMEQPSVEEFSADEPPVDELPAQEHSVEDQSMAELSTGELSIRRPSAKEPVGQEPEPEPEEEEEEEQEEEGGQEEEQEGEEEEVEEGQPDEEGYEEHEEDFDEEDFDEEDQDEGPSNQEQTYEVPPPVSPARTRSPPKSRRYADTTVPTNRGLEASMRSAGAPPTPIARFFGTISSYISGRSQANQTGEPRMPILKPVSRDPIDLIDDDDEPQFPVLNHVPTPIRPTPARQKRQKRVESRIDMPTLQHISPARPTTEATRGRPRMRRVGSVKELARSFEMMEEKSREEAEIARNVGGRRVVSESNKPRLIPAQVHYVAPSAPVKLNQPKVARKPAKTAPTVPLLPAVPPRAPPASSTRKTLKQPTRTRPAPPVSRKRVVPKKEVEVITISDTEA